MRAAAVKLDMTTEERLRRANLMVRWLIILPCLVVVVLGFILVGINYVREAESRRTLVQAQALRTAAHVVCMERMSANKVIHDRTQPTGFADGVGEDILELAGALGELYLMKVDETGFNIKEFLYIEDGYAVRCIDGGDEPDDFYVYRLDLMNEPAPSPSPTPKQNNEDETY